MTCISQSPLTQIALLGAKQVSCTHCFLLLGGHHCVSTLPFLLLLIIIIGGEAAKAPTVFLPFLIEGQAVKLLAPIVFLLFLKCA